MKKCFVRFLIILVIALTIFIFQFKSEFKSAIFEIIVADNKIPFCYIPLYEEAAEKYSIPWQLLAAVHRVETSFSNQNPMVSVSGAVGHFQFMPRTWVGWNYPGTELGNITDGLNITDVQLIKQYGGYGVDASGDGKADPFNLEDSAHTAAKYLADFGASTNDIKSALFAYNQSNEYVDKVFNYYKIYENGYEEEKMKFFCYQ